MIKQQGNSKLKKLLFHYLISIVSVLIVFRKLIFENPISIKKIIISTLGFGIFPGMIGAVFIVQIARDLFGEAQKRNYVYLIGMFILFYVFAKFFFKF